MGLGDDIGYLGFGGLIAPNITLCLATVTLGAIRD